MTTAAGWKGLPLWVLELAGVKVDFLGRTAIPYRTQDGRLHNIRLVRDDRRWWKFRRLPLIPFGLDRQWSERTRQYRCLAIVEGESDALALYAALGPDGLDVLGIPGAGAWKPDWCEYARGYDAVYIVGDGDQRGRALNWRVARDLPGSMVVELPDGDDVRSVLQRAGAGPLVDAIEEAEAFARLFTRLEETFGLAA